jgi:hypothetical protein
VQDFDGLAEAARGQIFAAHAAELFQRRARRDGTLVQHIAPRHVRAHDSGLLEKIDHGVAVGDV